MFYFKALLRTIAWESDMTWACAHTYTHTHTFLCMGRCRSLCSLKTSNYSFDMCLNYLGPVPCFSPILNSPQGGFTGSWLDGQQNLGTWMAGNILLFVYIFYWNDRWHFFFHSTVQVVGIFIVLFCTKWSMTHPTLWLKLWQLFLCGGLKWQKVTAYYGRMFWGSPSPTHLFFEPRAELVYGV